MNQFHHFSGFFSQDFFPRIFFPGFFSGFVWEFPLEFHAEIIDNYWLDFSGFFSRIFSGFFQDFFRIFSGFFQDCDGEIPQILMLKEMIGWVLQDSSGF